MSPRKYEAPRRRATSAATRLRILEAARRIVGGRGDLAEFSMESVAERAGVARMTVYNQFRSRGGLLEALADHLAERGGLSGLRGAFVEEDPGRAVGRLVEAFTGFWATDRLTMRRLRAMGVVGPAEDAAPRGRDAWRREAIHRLLARFPDRLGPRALGVRGEAVDLLAALTSFETFDALAVEGRTPGEVAQILSRAAVRLLGLEARPQRSVGRRPRGAVSRRRTPGTPPGRGGSRDRATTSGARRS